MSSTPTRGHKALRHGRWSSPNAEYFITVVTNQRQVGLVRIAGDLIDLAHAMELEGVWSLRTLTVMPDHVHGLVTLGKGSELSGTLRTFKGVGRLPCFGTLD
jgi:REP element-mobilizing transposase RayT